MTAIEVWMIVCVLFVFGALAEYAGVLLKIKIAASRSSTYHRDKQYSRHRRPVSHSIVFASEKAILREDISLDQNVRISEKLQINIKVFIILFF